MRGRDGRWRKGASGNPGGRRREGVCFEDAARRILEGRVPAFALDTVPAAARALLPSEATYHDALAAVLVTSSLAGDPGALRELLKRLWPAPKPVELSADAAGARTLADMLLTVRWSGERPTPGSAD